MDTAWTPMKLRFETGDVNINSVSAALVFLQEEWPSAKGQMVRRAVKHCTAALADPSKMGVAQLAFRAALSEMSIFSAARPQNKGDSASAAGFPRIPMPREQADLR